MIVLKQSIGMNVAMILGGLFLSPVFFAVIFGFGEFNDIHEFHSIVFGLLGLLGLLMSSVGVVALVTRAKLAITIDDAGIRLPVRNILSSRVVFIAREDILVISRHESIKGRLIVITTKSSEKVIIRAQFYCGLEQFLSHCKAHGLPVG